MTTLQMNQSRWGFHAVDFATYSKIKKLRYEFYQALHQAANRRRWDAKTKYRVGDRPTLNPKFEPLSYYDRHGRNPIRHAWIDELYFWAKRIHQTQEGIQPFAAKYDRKELDLNAALKLVDTLI